MKKIVTLLLDHAKETARLPFLVALGLVLAVSIGLNYHYDFEDSILDRTFGSPSGFFAYGTFFFVPMVITFVLIHFLTPRKDFLQKGGFWVLVLVIIAALGFRTNFYFYEPWIESLKYHERAFATKCLKQILSLFTFAVFLIPVYLLKDRKGVAGFYGYTFKGVKLGPYFVLLALMIPLLLWASFQADFLRDYPRYITSGGDKVVTYGHVDPWKVVTLFEVCYLLSFFAVELFFRGFLIFTLEKYLGPYVVFPMMAVYCFFHFGKPMGEAIGSIFGGYILGVIALRTRNIWGGFVVHVGVALLMDLFAYLQMPSD